MIVGLGKRAAKNFYVRAQGLADTHHDSEHAWSLRFHELKGARSNELASDIKLKLGANFTSIYTFELIDGASPEAVLQCYDSAKTLHMHDFALPRRIGGDGPFLYVGKSWKTAHRICDHLGLNRSRGTSALHLQHWASDLHGSIKISVFGYKSREYLQDLEDYFAGEELHPILGKRGAK